MDECCLFGIEINTSVVAEEWEGDGAFTFCLACA